MKRLLTRLTRTGLAASIALFGVSCTTSYDSSGRKQSVLTPEGAVLGAAAVGVAAYAIGKNNRKKRYHRSYGGQYGYGRHHDYRSSNYYGSHRGYSNGYRSGGYGGYGGYSGGYCPSY